MAIGDAAKAAGMDVVLETDDAGRGYEEDNRTRDYIANERAKSVRNNSNGSNVLGLQWDGPRGHLVARVDVTDVGHLAFTEDVRATNTALQAQLTEVFSRLYALENAGASAQSTESQNDGS